MSAPTSHRAGTDLRVAEASIHQEWKSHRAICLAIATLFLLKFAAFALFITPLWDSPDEPGHYSYVEDLSRGHYPILGQATINRDVVDSWLGSGHPQPRNWIPQHPPLFYALGAPIVAASHALGASFDTQVYSARLLSSFIGALTILGLMAFLTIATGRRLLGIAGGIFIGATPMFTQLSGAVTHDTLVACTAAWGCYWYARWIRSAHWSHALLCAFIIGLGCITKVTMLALAAPMFLAMAWRILRLERPFGFGPMVIRLGILWLVMFLPVSVWIIHNLLQFHMPFPDARILGVYPHNPNDMGYLHFMQKYPIWQIVLLNFIALIGWMGTLPGKVMTVQADGLVAAYFSAAILCCSLAAIGHGVRGAWQRGFQWPWLAATAVAAVVVCATMAKYDYTTVACIALFVAVVWVGVINLWAPGPDRDHAWLVFTGCIFILLFSFAYYHRILVGYREITHVKALHGRYFYPVLPFFALLMLRPLRRDWLPTVAVCVAVVALVVSDGFFLHHAFQMYGKY